MKNKISRGMLVEGSDPTYLHYYMYYLQVASALAAPGSATAASGVFIQVTPGEV